MTRDDDKRPTASLAQHLAEGAHAGYVAGRRLRRLEALLAPLVPEGARAVLDVGCGDGGLGRRLAARRPGARFAGVEVHVRRGTVGAASFPLLRYDGARLPFADGAFDAAVLSDVLHHAADPPAALADAARVVRRGGGAVLVKDHVAATPRARRVLAFMDRVGNDRFGVGVPANYLSWPEWERAVDAAGLGFDVVDRRPGMYPFPASLVFDGDLHVVMRLVRRA